MPVIPQHIFLYSVMLLLLCASCNDGKDPEEQAGKAASVAEAVAVETAAVEQGNFFNETMSNGRLHPYEKANLAFSRGGQLQQLHVRNGDRVQRGDTLAALNNRRALLQLEQARIQVEQARTDLLDLLLTQQGSELADTAMLSPEKRAVLLVKSGLKAARNQLKEARLNYSESFIIAPFSGRIANVVVQGYNAVTAGENFCLLMNDEQWKVVFHLMESELGGVNQGSQVEVMPFHSAESPVAAHITTLNPVVDDNGLVEAEALLDQNPSWMMEGRNVKVKVVKSLPGQLIVPKESMVLRSNREVVFTYEDGLAKWVYVNVVAENESQLAVAGKLQAGDEVIVTNNLNLSHDAEVTRAQKEKGSNK